MADRENRQMRCVSSNFKTREDGKNIYIEGYFAVFNSNYELWKGATESIAPGAFANTLNNDVRALINHETRLVLGRNTAGTLTLREDEHGLWGSILINPNDQDAMNLYARVTRGDVSQCSFGFNIVSEETEFFDDDSIHWTIREVYLYEVSIVTFPAYTETSVSARKKDFEALQMRKNSEWKTKIKSKLKGV